MWEMQADGHGNLDLESTNSFRCQVIRKSKAQGQKPSCCSRVKELQATIGKKVQMGHCCLSSLPLKGKEGQTMSWCNREKLKQFWVLWIYWRFTKGSSSSGQCWKQQQLLPDEVFQGWFTLHQVCSHLTARLSTFGGPGRGRISKKGHQPLP